MLDHRLLGDPPGHATPALLRRPAAGGLARGDRVRPAAARRSAHGLLRFSLGGGHAVTVGARESVSAIVALTTPPRLTAWIVCRARCLTRPGVTRRSRTARRPGQHGASTLAGEAGGFARAVVPGSPWQNAISPQVFLRMAFFRPVTRARRITVLPWVGLPERDVSAENAAAHRLATRAPRGELVRYPGMDHVRPVRRRRPRADRRRPDRVPAPLRPGLSPGGRCTSGCGCARSSGRWRSTATSASRSSARWPTRRSGTWRCSSCLVVRSVRRGAPTRTAIGSSARSGPTVIGGVSRTRPTRPVRGHTSGRRKIGDATRLRRASPAASRTARGRRSRTGGS